MKNYKLTAVAILVGGITACFAQFEAIQAFSSYMEELNEAEKADKEAQERGDNSQSNMRAVAAKYNISIMPINIDMNSYYNPSPTSVTAPTGQNCYTWTEYYSPPSYGYGTSQTVKILHKVCN